MKLKLILLFLAALLACISIPLFAQNRLVDNAGLLDNGQAGVIRVELDRVSKTYDFDLVIVTEKSIGSESSMDYADDFFDYSGYGLGEDRDGCLFLQVTDIRDHWISTSGRGIGIYNEAALDNLEAKVIKQLRKDSYYEAYLAFIKASEEYLKLDAKGRSYSYLHSFFPIFIIASWILALLIGLIVVASWKKSMNNALLKTEAASYIVPNTLSFADKRDRFLYSTVTKMAKPKSSSSGGGHTHTSSSGRSHGGRGGRY